MRKSKLSIPRLFGALILYTVFTFWFYLILDMGSGDIWDDLMKLCRRENK